MSRLRTGKVFLSTLLFIVQLFSEESNPQIVKLQRSSSNDNMRIRLHSEEIVDGDHPLLLEVISFPLGVHLDSDQYIGFREFPEGSCVLVYFNGETPIQITFDDKNPFIEQRTYFKNNYRKKLSQDFLNALPSGANVVTVVALNSYGESIKHPGAVDIVFLNVKQRGEISPEKKAELHKPYLLYNQPTGTFYDNQSILLDFYLFNVSLSSIGYKVQVYVDGKLLESLDDWKPYAIQGLAPGYHEIELKLVDRKGDEVSGPYQAQKARIKVVPNTAQSQQSNDKEVAS